MVIIIYWESNYDFFRKGDTVDRGYTEGLETREKKPDCHFPAGVA